MSKVAAVCRQTARHYHSLAKAVPFLSGCLSYSETYFRKWPFCSGWTFLSSQLLSYRQLTRHPT